MKLNHALFLFGLICLLILNQPVQSQPDYARGAIDENVTTVTMSQSSKATMIQTVADGQSIKQNLIKVTWTVWPDQLGLNDGSEGNTELVKLLDSHFIHDYKNRLKDADRKWWVAGQYYTGINQDVLSWQDKWVPLTRQSDGSWQGSADLPPGIIHYKFVVASGPNSEEENRAWTRDPWNPYFDDKYRSNNFLNIQENF